MARGLHKAWWRTRWAAQWRFSLSYPAHANVDRSAASLLGGELPIGARLGRFVIRGRLGAGGMGVVYRADDLRSGRTVALKTLHERDPVALYNLKREFRSLADVSHPNLVSLGQLAIDGSRPFFTMELVDGTDFGRWVEAGPAPWQPGYCERLRAGVRQIARGLRALHAAGKVHCDLKPSNVLVTRDGRIVIVDFGLVRERPMVGSEASEQLWGTALYMAPEQARTARVGAPADWYSLGVILYRYLTGVFPFTGTPMEILLAKQDREPPPPSAVSAGVPEDLDALCMALLSRDPELRPGSAKILALLGEEGTGTAPRDTSTLALRSLFVGRRDELAVLGRALDRTHQEHVAVLLHGDSGVGKTSLVRHFFERVRAERSDAVVLTGRCYQRDSMPYRALDSVIDSLSDHLRKVAPRELGRLLPEDAGLLGQVFPVIARVPAIAEAMRASVEVHDRQQLRARVLTALRDLLSRLAARAPVIIFIDDLQWADADGLALLADLFHGASAPRVLLLGTVRTEHELSLAGLDRVVHHRVVPLPPAEAEALAEALLQRVHPSLVSSAASIASEAGGHPLFIDELVRHRARARSWPDARGAASGLDDAIWQRIRRLDLAGRALMTAVAIAEVPLGIEAASLATGSSVEQSEQVAARLVGAQLARAVPTVDDSLVLQPYHDRVREVLVSRLEPGVRARWHRSLADALYRTGAADHAPLELIRHLTLAGAPLQAAALAARAAQRASASLAFESAAELYRLALDIGYWSQDAALTLRRDLADALIYAGRGSEAATVLQQLAGAVDDAATRAACLRRAAEQLLLNGHIDDGLALLDRVASDSGVRVPATNRGALARLALGRVRLRLRGLGWRERAPAEVSDHALLVQDAHHTVGTILGLVDPVRGLALTTEATLQALRLGVRDRVIRALTTEAVGRASAGDRARADALIERAIHLSREAGDAGALAWVTGMAAMVAYTTGRFGEAVSAVDRSMALQASLGKEAWDRLTTGGVYEVAVLRLCRMIARTCLGRLNEVRGEFHDWLHDARRRGDRFTAANAARGLNVVWLFDDDPERARHELAADLWTPPRASFHIQQWMVLRSAVQIHLYCGTAARAGEELAEELDRSKRALLMRVRPLRAEQDWILGRLWLAEAEAAGPGSKTEARRRRQALAAARRLNRFDLPQSKTAAALLGAGVAFQRGDLDAAVELLLRAESIASRASLRVMEAAAQRRRGAIIGGSAGYELIATADRWARCQGIRAPEKIARMYAPGFDRAER